MKNTNVPPRVAAINDISCLGRCSLTVALPILSGCGIETNIIPSAVLSTHTGGFTGFTFRDLDEDMLPIAKHWKTLGRSYSSVYTGYLGSFAQQETVMNIIDTLSDDKTLVFVDPVMGDSGKLYGNFDKEFAYGMRRLCRMADVITPNVTEAFYLLGKEYYDGPYTEEQIREIIDGLSEITDGSIVLTGIFPDKRNVGVCYREAGTDEIKHYYRRNISGGYHGAGDVFGSVLLGKMLSGDSLDESVRKAVDFTIKCIKFTKESGQEYRYGLIFEPFMTLLGK